MLNKGRESAERATETARQAKLRMESELARMQRLVAELEHAKRCAFTVFISRHWSMLHAALLQVHLQRRGHFKLKLAVSQAMETCELQNMRCRCIVYCLP